MPDKRLLQLLADLEAQGGGPLVEAIKTEHELFDKERKLNADARKKLLRIVYAMVVCVLALGILSVVQQFKNGQLADDNAEAIAQIQTNRVQLTYETCGRQNDRLAQSLKALRDSESDPKSAALRRALADALGLTDAQLREFTESNQKSTTALIVKLVLDDPVIQTDDGPRRDCEAAIVERFGRDALLADLEPSARERVRALLRN